MNNIITLEDVCGTTISTIVSEATAGVGLRQINLISKITPSNVEHSFQVFCMKEYYHDLNIDEAIAKYNSFNSIFHPEY